MPEPDLYRPVDPKISFPKLEEALMGYWKDNDVFHRSLKQREGATEWIFYEGPPTANGKPGIHHVEARTFKDFFCRFQTMRGHYVHRKAGWDCHGLPVEIEVEKELGITEKRQIEEFGIERFVQRCRESVQRYVADWDALTQRIGFWLDLEDAYWTMTPDYVESVWWILRQIWDKGLLEEDFKVVPYCPRCETSLSSHELAQPGAYKDVTDPSIYFRFPLVDDPDTALLVWTTTPWTLLSNTLAAVGPDIRYATIEDPDLPGRRLILATELVEKLFGEATPILSEQPGAALVDRAYEPPFPWVEAKGAHLVKAGDFVTTTDGSGIVHLAPYGIEDLSVLQEFDLPVTQMIDASGKVVGHAGKFGGLWIKDADVLIIDDLRERGVLWRAEDHLHSYPHCWRCHTPLLYYPRKDWYIRTSRVRDQLQASNEGVNWQPPTIKHGRFGDWLANNVDWSLSRDRYWGTPLPIWRCEQGHATCVGSFGELSELSGSDLSGIDPHRPHVDEIKISCPECSAEATRVRSVIDAWFDSGSMPFAQWHYPFENSDIFKTRFPADFISEAIDQTRGWFYSLLAIATLVEGQSSYRNVVCLGHLVDEDGRKMSKSLGNVIDPWSIVGHQGADALRWVMLAAGSPWSTRRVGEHIVEEALRKYILTLWNTYSFWVTYASLEGFDPTTVSIPVSERAEIDRWILAELDDAVREVTQALEGFDATAGGKRLDRLVDDLSNWYVRRSRRRFWKSGADRDTQAAFLTLWECLVAIAQMSAPYTPFVSDEIYMNLTAPDNAAPDSVHLSDWPEPNHERRDDELRRRMQLVRSLVGLGRAARTDAKIKVRQPLARALVVIPTADAELLAGLEALVAEELNVRSIEPMSGIEELVTYSVKPNFKALGPRFGARVKQVAAALGSADAASLVHALEQDGTVRVEVDGVDESFVADELDVRVEGRSGFSLAREGAYGVALDLEITPELRSEGIAREVVRAIQDLRKDSGLAVEDRIELWLSWDSEVAGEALSAHSEWIAGEVLATRTHLGEESLGDARVDHVDVDHGRAIIGLRKA